MILPKKKMAGVIAITESKASELVLDSEGMKQLADYMTEIWKGWEFKGKPYAIHKMQDQFFELIKFLRGE
jgi:hypothetical protein